MKILKELEERGILNNITSENKLERLAKGAGVYAGFDPTAESLHLGNYIQIAVLKKFVKAGFSVIAVLGGATGMIGDPSGKSKERNLLSQEVFEINKNKIKAQLESQNLKVVDNYDFYKNMNILTFLREVGKNLNVNYMINKDIVKNRLETGISFTEFSYQLIQGWDFKCLYQDYGVRIQIGGSDQWGNITAGIELIRKTCGEDNLALGITTNLMTTSSGKKFGKSEGNALFLDRTMTSPFEVYQYLFNTSDDDVKKLLLWLTSCNISDIEKIIQTHLENPRRRFAQKKLAYLVLEDIHSNEDAETALKLTEVLFAKGSMKDLSAKQVLTLSGSIPTFVKKTGNIQEVLVEIGAAQSKRQAREFISAGAINVNGELITEESFNVIPESFEKKATLIKRGKKNFYLIKY